MDRSAGWLQPEKIPDSFKTIEVEMDPGTYFVGDVSLLLSERDRANLEYYVFPADIEAAFEGELWLNSGRRIVIFHTIGTRATHVDSDQHKYHLREPAIGITLVKDMNDPLLQCGRLVTYTEPFICSSYDFLKLEEDSMVYATRLLDFGPAVTFDLTDTITHLDMKLTSDPKVGRVRTWQNTKHFKEGQPLSNALLFWLQSFNVLDVQRFI